eukprot:TRINITY_DN33544_c0_g1_i1.p1 TRINITY_DN33544_c0_g1~~TRINITY_DN33544_c0_g1_i1.p1  ORF type:complete len:113 (+),score=14.43 TRINITY_DN33544_c0_g1_i1:63-401(+)
MCIRDRPKPQNETYLLSYNENSLFIGKKGPITRSIDAHKRASSSTSQIMKNLSDTFTRSFIKTLLDILNQCSFIEQRLLFAGDVNGSKALPPLWRQSVNCLLYTSPSPRDQA